MNSPKILLITSNFQNCKEIVTILARENFLVVTATTESIGIQLAREQLPDVIICELKELDLDGYRVLSELSLDSHTAAIPFIFLTTIIEPQQWRKGMEMGADDFLIVPFTASELTQAIAARLSKKAAMVAQTQQELERLRHSIAAYFPHEVRTALTGILAASELLSNKLELLDFSVMVELLNYIRLSGQRLDRLMGNILLHTELELVSKQPEQVQILRSDRLNSAKQIIEAEALRAVQKNNRQADLYLQIQDASVQINKSNLAKLVEELVDNACKFSPLGAPIRLTTKIDKDCFILSVSDRGRGMSAQQIACIEAYRQFDRLTYEQQGSGLGLAIAQQLAQIYGGQLIVDSILSQGTNVTVLLPLERQFSNGLKSTEIVFGEWGVVSGES